MADNQLQQMVRLILYKLKRDYGFPVDLYRSISNFNPATGEKNITKTKYSINRAVVLPADLSRKFAYDLGYLAANKNFTYGAGYDINQQGILIDTIDLPIDFKINLDDYIICDHKRYDIKTVDTAEHKLAYFLIVRGVEGGQVGEVHEVKAFSSFRLIQRLVTS